MSDTTTPDIQFSLASETSNVPRSPSIYRSWKAKISHLVWYEFHRQKAFLVCFPILGAILFLILRSNASFQFTNNKDIFVLTWPALHMLFSAFLTFGPDYENNSWGWDHWFPSGWLTKLLIKTCAVLISPLLSFLGIVLVQVLTRGDIGKTLYFCYMQDHTRYWPFISLAVLLTLLNPAFIRNTVLVLVACGLLGVLNSGTYSHYNGQHFEGPDPLFQNLRIGFGILCTVSVPFVFRWRMNCDTIVPFQPRFSFLANRTTKDLNKVEVPASAFPALVILQFLVLKHRWLIAAFVGICLAPLFQVFIRSQFFTHVEWLSLALLFVSIGSISLWGTSMADRQREFFRQLPISKPFFFLISLIPFLMIPVIAMTLVLTVFGFRSEILIGAISMFFINTCCAMSIRSRLIAWAVGSTISFLHFVLIFSAGIVCNFTFQFYLSFSILPFAIFPLWNLSSYFSSDKLLGTKKLLVSSSIWVAASICILITGRVYSIPYYHQYNDKFNPVPYSVTVELPVLPPPTAKLYAELPKQYGDLYNDDIRIDSTGAFYNNYGNHVLSGESEKAQFFRESSTRPGGYSILENGQGYHYYSDVGFLGWKTYAYAISKNDMLLKPKWQKLLNGELKDHLRILEKHLQEPEDSYKITIGANNNNHLSVYGQQRVIIFSWLMHCRWTFNAAIGVGDRETALRSLTLQKQLIKMIQHFSWLQTEHHNSTLPQYGHSYSHFLVPTSDSSLAINRWDTFEGLDCVIDLLPEPVDLRLAETVSRYYTNVKMQNVANRSVWGILNGDYSGLPWEKARSFRMILEGVHYRKMQRFGRDSIDEPVTWGNWLDKIVGRRFQANPNLPSYFGVAVRFNRSLASEKARLRQLQWAWKIYRYDKGMDKPEWNMKRYLKGSKIPDPINAPGSGKSQTETAFGSKPDPESKEAQTTIDK